MHYTRLTIICCALLLAACSDKAPEEPKKTTKHIWQGQVDMLDEAKTVSDEVNEMTRIKEERMKNLD